MWNRLRAHRITSVKTLAELTTLLSEHEWTLCTGFRWERFLLLNDSLRADSPQEYAVVLESGSLQIESLTVSWMTPARIQETLSHLEEHRHKLLRDHLPLDHGWPMALPIQLFPHPHGPCPQCR